MYLLNNFLEEHINLTQQNSATNINGVNDNSNDLNKQNVLSESVSLTNGINNQKYTNGCHWSLEDITKGTLNNNKCENMEREKNQPPKQNNATHSLNTNNSNCKPTAFSISDVFEYNDDDLYEDEMRITRKVRRCFGKTVCMPQTLLCFKVWLVFSISLMAHKHI